MKTASIFHGLSSGPDSFWIPWLRQQLEDSGYDAWAPQLPNADTPVLSEWLDAALARNYDEDSVLVAHSVGCALVVALLERLETPVRQTILVAGFISPLESVPMDMFQTSYDAAKVAENAGELFIINSDNDPFGCGEKSGQEMFDQFGGNLVIRHGDGHMGSNDYNQPYKEFPLLRRLIG